MRLRLFFWISSFYLAALFFFLLGGPIGQMLPETDLWWLLPAFPYYRGQVSGPWELLGFLLSPFPSNFAFPVHRIYLWVLEELLGLPFRALVLGNVLFHFLNAGLVYKLSRLFGLSWKVAALAGITFLCSFVHFHAYLWLPALQHVLAVTMILATLCLFLATERRLAGGKGGRLGYALTLAAVLADSFQNGAILGSLLILSHILIASGTDEERRLRYDRWLPVLLVALLYPIVILSFFDVKPLIEGIARIPLSPWIKAPVLWLGWAGFLLLIRWIIRLDWSSPRLRRAGRGCWIGTGTAALAALALRDSRQLFFPYNAIVPFASTLGSFLDPVQRALLINSAYQYQYIPPNVSAFLLLLSCLFLAVFIGAFLRHKKGLAVLGVWYAFCLAYLLFHRHVASSMPFQNQSRYYVYFTPIFSIILAASAAYLFTRLTRPLRWPVRRIHAVLLGVFVLFGSVNLLAIRIALFRGKLVNSYYLYDDFRAVQLIGQDLSKPDRGHPGARPILGVEGVLPLSFKRKWNPPADPVQIQYANFRRLLKEWVPSAAKTQIRVNPDRASIPPSEIYRIEGTQVYGPDGQPLDRFTADVQQALQHLQQGQREEAFSSFQRAAQERPFLLNYILTRRGRLSDLDWITQGSDMNDWLGRVRRQWRLWSIAPPAKWERISNLMAGELSDYALCLFCLSYLEQESGRPEQSKFWFSQLRFLERDPDRLALWMAQNPAVVSTPPLRSFLEKARDPAYFRKPLPWRKNDYAFGRFLIRWVLHWDIRSRWDRESVRRVGWIP